MPSVGPTERAGGWSRRTRHTLGVSPGDALCGAACRDRGARQPPGGRRAACSLGAAVERSPTRDLPVGAAGTAHSGVPTERPRPSSAESRAAATWSSAGASRERSTRPSGGTRAPASRWRSRASRSAAASFGTSGSCSPRSRSSRHASQRRRAADVSPIMSERGRIVCPQSRTSTCPYWPPRSATTRRNGARRRRLTAHPRPPEPARLRAKRSESPLRLTVGPTYSIGAGETSSQERSGGAGGRPVAQNARPPRRAVPRKNPQRGARRSPR